MLWVILNLYFLAKMALGAEPNWPFPTRSMEISLPNAKPLTPEAYICTPMKIDPKQTSFVVGFKPKADAKTAHHLLIYGCKRPGLYKPLFNCGDMAVKQKNLPSASNPCGSGRSDLFCFVLFCLFVFWYLIDMTCLMLKVHVLMA